MRERAALGVLAGERGSGSPRRAGSRRRAPRPAPSRSRPRASARAGARAASAASRSPSKPSGSWSSCSFSASSRSAGTAVTTAPPVSAGILPSFVGRGSAIDAFSRSCAARSSCCVSSKSASRLVLGEDALVDELGRVELADGRLRGDLRDHQRLRVRGLVLLVVAEAAVADEVDDDVVAELLPVGEREPDRRDRRLRVVRVHVDDRDVEPLREVARVARRAALVRVGREADLVVRDQVERAAGRVAVEAGEVERLGDDALARERRVAVDQDRQRDGGVVDAGAARAVGLLGARPALDDRDRPPRDGSGSERA